jgi:hypothetical protein
MLYSDILLFIFISTTCITKCSIFVNNRLVVEISNPFSFICVLSFVLGFEEYLLLH